MVPITPATAYLRPRPFVKEEWDHFISSNIISPTNATKIDSNTPMNADGGWRGILFANLALVDPRASYAFFRDGLNGFWDERWIDGGASRTWYLVWAVGVGEGRR